VSGRRAPRAYLLSGLLRCGKCAKTLYSSRRVDSLRYVCLSGPDHRGCGGLTVVAPPLEEMVSEYVLLRLDSRALSHAIAGRSSDNEDAARLQAEVAEDRERLDYLTDEWAAKKLDNRQWERARRPIEARIEAKRGPPAATDAYRHPDRARHRRGATPSVVGTEPGPAGGDPAPRDWQHHHRPQQAGSPSPRPGPGRGELAAVGAACRPRARPPGARARRLGWRPQQCRDPG